MADTVGYDPVSDAMSFTFEVVDKATAQMKNIEASVIHAAESLSRPLSKVKDFVGQTAAYTQNVAASLNTSVKHWIDAGKQQEEALSKLMDKGIKKFSDEYQKVLAALGKKTIPEAVLPDQEVKKFEEHTKKISALTGVLQGIKGGLGAGFAGLKSSFSLSPDNVGLLGSGIITGMVGQSTMDFDKQMTSIRRNIGMTQAEYENFRQTALRTARDTKQGGLLMEDMVDLLQTFSRSFKDIGTGKELSETIKAFDKMNLAAGYSVQQAAQLTKIQKEYFNLTGTGLTDNAMAWTKITQSTTLSHEELVGLLDAQKMAVDLSVKHGEALEVVQEHLVRGVDAYQRMGVSAGQALNTINKLAEPTKNMPFAATMGSMLHMGIEEMQQEAVLHPEKLLTKVRRAQMREAAQFGPTAAMYPAVMERMGIGSVEELRQLLRGAEEAGGTIRSARARGDMRSEDAILDEEELRIRGKLLQDQKDKQQQQAEVTANVLSSEERLSLAVDKVRNIMIEGMLPIADKATASIGALSEKIVSISDKFEKWLPLLEGLSAGSALFSSALGPVIGGILKLGGKGLLGLGKLGLSGGRLAAEGLESAGTALFDSGVGGNLGAKAGMAAVTASSFLTQGAGAAFTSMAGLSSVFLAAGAGVAIGMWANSWLKQQPWFQKGIDKLGDFLGGHADTKAQFGNANAKNEQLKALLAELSYTKDEDKRQKIVEKIRALRGQTTTGPASSMDYKGMDSFVQGQGFTVTSDIGGEHNVGSKHYLGKAVDVRTQGKSVAEVESFIAAAKNQGYTVRDERTRPAGQKEWSGPHLHLEAPDSQVAGSQMVAQAVKDAAAQAPGQTPNDPVFTESPVVADLLKQQLSALKSMVAILTKPDAVAGMRAALAGGNN